MINWKNRLIRTHEVTHGAVFSPPVLTLSNTNTNLKDQHQRNR